MLNMLKTEWFDSIRTVQFIPKRMDRIKGVGPGPTLAWTGWKQPDIPVEVDTGRLETDVGMKEF